MVRVSVCLRSAPSGSSTLRSPSFPLSPFSATSIPRLSSLAPFCHRPIACKPCPFNSLQTLSIINRGWGCAPPLSLQVLLEFQNETTTCIRLRGSELQLRHTVGRSRRIPFSSASEVVAGASSGVCSSRAEMPFRIHRTRITQHGTRSGRPHPLPFFEKI